MRAEARAAPGPRAPRWAWWVATGLGSGYLRPAPGTWGSLAGLALWSALVSGAGQIVDPAHARTVLLGLGLLAPLLMTGLAIHASTLVVRETGLKDPGFIVADEWAGLWVALLPLLANVPLGSMSLGGQAARLAAPFLLFRLFDIWKPWPVHQLQALPEGWGIVLDDVAAGLCAALGTLFLDRALLGWLTAAR